jgi:hypothetical protein
MSNRIVEADIRSCMASQQARLLDERSTAQAIPPFDISKERWSLEPARA